MDDTDIEYFEVRFASEADLEAARGAIVVKAELGSGAVLVSSDMMSAEEILEAAAVAGIARPDISDSGITDEDMWPEWPEDSLDEEERPFAAAL
ncbi:hypothetical protein D3C71_808660 [compost metagenome]